MSLHTELLPAASKIQQFSGLQEDILRVLLYFDIFQHPLKPEEIYAFLPSDSTSPAEIVSTCLAAPFNGIVHQKDEHFFIADSPGANNFPPRRLENEQRARTYLSIARFLASLIRRFPFVRAVFISGELSKGVATRHGDIDFFIITAEERLWIARTFLILFKKIFLLNSKKFFCLNHFITERSLEVRDRNFYSALEIATLKPIYNFDLFKAYLEANSWIREYFPNLRSPFSINGGRSFSLVQGLIETVFPGRFGDALDRWLMESWKRIWKRRYPGLPKEKRDDLFQCDRSISTAYAGDFRPKVFKRYRAQLQRFGLDGRNLEG